MSAVLAASADRNGSASVYLRAITKGEEELSPETEERLRALRYTK